MTKDVKLAKAQARRLADAMARFGTPVPLARAYELSAQAAGHADWNTMVAALARKSPGWQLGQSVQGRYMGRPFRGTIKGLQAKGADLTAIDIALDQPVDVGTPSLPIARRRLRATLARDGVSVGRRSDGVAHLVLD